MDYPSGQTVEVNALYAVQSGVSPAQVVAVVIDGQIVGKSQISADQHFSETSVQVCHLYLRALSVPIGPKHFAAEEGVKL